MSKDNTQDEARTDLCEKVEGLFDLRVSSSGADMGIGFKSSRERIGSDRIWIDGDEWIELRKNIESLVNSEVCQVLDRLKKESIEYATGDEMAELVYENLIPLPAIEAERKQYE